MPEPHIEIKIAGNKLPTFKSFDLIQPIYDHHTFELVIGHGVAEALGGHTLDNSKQWIGQPLTAEFGDNEFEGLITSISMSHFHGLNGDLVIRGASPTIKLEAGPHNQSWNEKPLDAIVNGVLGEVGLTGEVAPVYTDPLTFIAQYRESHFGFLKRLACSFHEWFYYDGRVLKFGKPSPPETLSVYYGPDIQSLDISMRISPLKAKGFSYHSLNDENIEASTTNSVGGLNDMGQEALGASLDQFALEPQSSVVPRIEDKANLETILESRQGAQAADLMTLQGVGKKMEMSPGSVIDVKTKLYEDGSWIEEPYGNFLVTSVSHHITGNLEYNNNFEAISADSEYLPEPNFQLPVAEPQIATVLSNADPENKGRVEVKFLWQSGDMKSPWLRVMTPDGGNSDKVGVNRGLLAIPEEGDQVMVGFRYNDIQRPFVMGGMYNGSTGAGGGDNNITKSYTTRSGNTIVFNDEEKSVTVMDAEGNLMNMDGKGNISVSSSSTITLSCGGGPSIHINAKEDLISISAKTVLIDGKETSTMKSGGSMVATDSKESTTTVMADSVTVNGNMDTSINGGSKTSVSSSGKVEVMGAIVTLN